jgi:hypothetical protein
MVSASLSRADQSADRTGGTSRERSKRLGVLLERAKVPRRLLAPLGRRVTASRPLTAMLPARPRRGRINSKWRSIENDR